MNLNAPGWLQPFLDEITLWDLLIALAAGFAVVVFIRKKGWRAVKAFAHGVINAEKILVAVQDSPEFQTEVKRALREIHHETHTNTGTSLKDAVKRTEEAVGRLEIGMKGVYEQLDTLAAADARHEEADERLAAADAELRAELEQHHPKE